MRLDIFLALLVFCVVAGVTPGPNNMMLMASGVNFGVRRSLPHLTGVVFGFALMVAIPCSGVWVLLGAAMRRLLADPGRARAFNFTLARAGVLGMGGFPLLQISCIAPHKSAPAGLRLPGFFRHVSDRGAC